MKHYLLLLMVYLAFVWQAALRTDIAWNGYTPNFLAAVLVIVLWSLSDVRGLLAAGFIGLLSDSLAADYLGSDLLCYVSVATLIQMVCPPKLLRHTALLVVLVLATTGCIEFSSIVLRSALNHELANATSVTYASWMVHCLGDGLYTAVLASTPLLAVSVWQNRMLQQTARPVGNNWHRLTS